MSELDYTGVAKRKKVFSVRRIHVAIYKSVLLSCAVVLLTGCGDESNSSTVTGSVSFSEAVTLKPNWRVVVTLADTSIIDGPSIVLGEFSKDAPTKAPILYSIPYNASRIEENHSYSVSASVFDTNTAEPTLLYITTQNYPVLTNGFGKEVDVTVSSVGPTQ